MGAPRGTYMWGTEIDCAKTAGEIQVVLARAGAQAVMMEYDEEGEVEFLNFRLKVKGQFMSFQLPARWRAVAECFKERDYLAYNMDRRTEQAKRTAWRMNSPMGPAPMITTVSSSEGT